ncbi:MAG: alpha/beta hydrolase [Pseudonocardia sp.]|nr:alpha/beta hydrolase [Pseudonocardia sp.]
MPVCQGAAVIDPQVQALLNALESSGGVPLVRGSATETREHYRELSLARRGPGFVPEAVADVVDETIDGPAGPLPLRSYTPTDDRGRVVTYLHGGGWVMGDLDTHDPVCRRVANALGALVVAVDYRLGPEHRHPAAVDDVTTAMEWVAAQHPGRVRGVAGDSAGATLAAVGALATRGTPVEAVAQMLLYPATDPSQSRPSVRTNGEGYFLTAADVSWFYDHYLTGGPADASFDLLAADVAGAAPAVVATAEFDPLRDEGDAYAERLRAADVPVVHIPGPGLVHGYFGFLGVADAADRQSAAVLATFDALLDGRTAG